MSARTSLESKITALEQQVSNAVETMTVGLKTMTEAMQKMVILADGKVSDRSQTVVSPNPVHSGQTAASTNPWASIKFGQLSSFGWKYIDLDSAYRSRKLYPLASDFVVPFTNAAPGSTTFSSIEPVSNGLPFEAVTVTDVVYDNPTGGLIKISNPTYNLNNFFINSYISSIAGQIAKVIQYTVTPSTGNLMYYNSQIFPVVGQQITLSREKPVIPFILADPFQSTSSYVTFPVYPFITFSTVPNFYNGMFMIISDFLFTNIINPDAVRVITSYDPALNRFTVNPPFAFVPLGGVFLAQISQFSYDGVQPLYMVGTHVSQPVCFDVQLLGLAIPNQILASSYGGTVDNYPYINVYFANNNDHNGTVIYSNNPNSTRATFKIFMSRQQAGPGSFSVFLNQGVAAQETIKLLLNESFRIRISTPDGQALQFQEQDNAPPFPPDPLLQISALMAVRRSF